MLFEQNCFIEKLFIGNYGKLFSYAKRMTGSPEQADDLVQDTFQDAVVKIDVLMRHEAPEKWLMRTLQFKIANYFRSERRYQQVFLPLGLDALPSEPVSPDDPESTVIGRMARHPAARIRASLTAAEFDLLYSFAFEGLSHAQLAAKYGISVGASHKRLSRTRKKLNRIFPGGRKNVRLPI